MCCTCKVLKPIIEFHIKKRSGGGVGTTTKCRGCKREYDKKRHTDRRDEFIARMRERDRRIRRRILERYGGPKPACACCGEARYEFLAIDHIKGGGGKERREKGSGTRFYYWLIKSGFPEGYRVLCHNCNLALGIYGFCPHDREREMGCGRPPFPLA